ncbi:MAG TPA: hypothetical protein VMT33_04655 [Candidatus Bathyarchaeia archaeon]|nr:hypothetical protein [Candidatus Bathyarchaeia archaeon]
MRLLLALIVAAAAAVPPPPAIYDPDPTQEGAGTLERETWSKQSPTASVWLTRIDEPTRARFVARRTGLDFDPFATAPGRTGGFVAFHILLENKTEERMVFQPQACWLHTSMYDMQRPLDLPSIVSAFHMADRPIPDHIDRIRAAIFDGEVVLGPGETKDALMVFREFDQKAKRYQVDVGAILTRGEALKFSAFYKKRKKEKDS